MDARYGLTGLLVGFLVGLTGMGGGSLMTPLLILLLGVKPSIAVGSDLAYAAITKAIGAFQHHRQNTVNHALAYRLAIGSVPASLLGVSCVHCLEVRYGEAGQEMLMRLLGFTLICVAVVMLARAAGLLDKWNVGERAWLCRGQYAWAVPIGALLGFFVGLTSVGSGTLFGVVLVTVFGLNARDMVGTDIYHAAILSFAAASAHVWAGHVNYALVANLLVGSIPGVLIGGHLAVRMPEKILRPTVAVVVLASGLKMI